MRHSYFFLCCLLLTPISLFAEGNTQPVNLVTTQDSQNTAKNSGLKDEMQTIVIHGKYRPHTAQADTAANVVADSANLLKTLPGASLNKNGELSSVAQYRGMFGDRVNVSLDGISLSSGGPNAMDTPLSYAPAPLLDNLSIYRGIAPVSSGQETLGGSIIVNSQQAVFSKDNSLSFKGSTLNLGGQSVNHGQEAFAKINAASRHHAIYISALDQRADDTDFNGGKIIPSTYERQRYDVAYRGRQKNNEWSVNLANNSTGNSGTPSLPMDIDSIDTDLYRLGFNHQFNQTSIKTILAYNTIDHSMSNYRMRSAPISAKKRRTLAKGENIFGKISFETPNQDNMWRYGVDLHQASHQANISNPDNAKFFVINFNDVERHIFSLFNEYDRQINERLFLQSGLRLKYIEMNAGKVNSSMANIPSMMGMAVKKLRDDFNHSDRQQQDWNGDFVISSLLDITHDLTFTSALAFKTRAPSYQERYLWLPMEATGGLADGRTYIGNIDLDSEQAQEIELGLNYIHRQIYFTPRIFYKNIRHYIQGTPSNNKVANTVSMMMSGIKPLHFNNVEAAIYGADLELSYRLNSHWNMRSIISYVRGKRKDIDDNLYRITPANMLFAVDYKQPRWGLSLENHLYAQQHHVSATNNEQSSAGYGLLNSYGYWQAYKNLQLKLGVNNISNKEHYDHLTGINRAKNHDVKIGGRLPGNGRNFYASLQWDF